MNLRDMSYLVAVADTGHFGRAAQRCFVSQPTLSGQIKKLEEELGVVIFERTRRSVKITPVGEQILAHARLILEQADSIRQLAQRQQDPLAGPLRIGAIPTLSPYLVPLILKPLRQQFPQMKLLLSEELTNTLVQRLQFHEIDAALLATDVDDHEFDSIPLFEEPFWVAFERDHPLYLKDKITRKDLQASELLLLSEGNCLSSQALDVLQLGSRDNTGEMADLRASNLETLIQLVAAGQGVTLVPALAMLGSWTSGSGVVTRPLEIKGAARRVSLVYRRSFPRMEALQAFADLIANSLPNTVNRLI